MASSTNTMTLRPFRLSDVDDFMGWAGDAKVSLNCHWDTFTSREDATDFLAQVIASHPWYRAICVDQDRPVGYICVIPGEIDGKNQRRGEVGYALSADYWGKGIATQALKMAMSTVFKEELKHLERVEGLVYEDNKGSQKVMEKAGFAREGLLRKYVFVKGKSRDVVVYSFLKTQIL